MKPIGSEKAIRRSPSGSTRNSIVPSRRASAQVGKNVPLPGGGYVPRLFSTWAPTFIAGIGKQADTAEDRAVIIALKRKLSTEKVKPLRAKDGGDLVVLARKIARFVADNETQLRTHDPAALDVDNDRAKDVWEPLLAIAETAGGEWPERARAAGKALVRRGGGGRGRVQGQAARRHPRIVPRVSSRPACRAIKPKAGTPRRWPTAGERGHRQEASRPRGPALRRFGESAKATDSARARAHAQGFQDPPRHGSAVQQRARRRKATICTSSKTPSPATCRRSKRRLILPLPYNPHFKPTHRHKPENLGKMRFPNRHKGRVVSV